MIIMQYGRALQPKNWHVLEKRPPQYVRIYHMDGGDVLYRDAYRSMPLKKGMLYVFPAQSAYEMTQSPQDAIACMYLHADVFPYIIQHPIEIDPMQYPDIRSTLVLMQNQLAYPDAGAPCFTAFSLALLQLLIRDGFISRKIDGALLDADGLCVSSVEDMSRRAGYSREHFIRSFSRAAGITPYQFILGQRMNEAIALMHQGLKLEEIAQRVGYASAKSFSGAFKRRFSISPQVYRDHFLSRA